MFYSWIRRKGLELLESFESVLEGGSVAGPVGSGTGRPDLLVDGRRTTAEDADIGHLVVSVLDKFEEGVEVRATEMVVCP